MTKSEHTPGPWAVGQHPAMTWGFIVKPVLFGNKAVALHECEGGHILLKSEADANLIAAAPDLLDALEYAVSKYGKGGGPWNVPSDPGGWIECAHAAIAKAKGNEP